MLIYSRERLLAELLKVGTLVDRFVQHESEFPQSVMAWFTQLEQLLGQLRSPLSGMVATERGRILAALAGAGMAEAHPRRSAARRAAGIVALSALERVQEALRHRISELDERLETAREKMTQLLAVGSARVPIPMPSPGAPALEKDVWLDQVFRAMSTVPEVSGMYRYLAGALSAIDRRQLLDEILTQLLGAIG